MAVNINPFIEDAKRIQEETGIPASIILGQIMLESGGGYSGGLSGLAAQAKNLFGIKGSGTAGSVLLPTTEYKNGKYVTVQANFRKYNSFYDSMKDHAALLSNERYAKYLRNAKSVNEFAEGIKKGGYATDPNYVNKLINVISSNNLHQYDNGVITFNPTTSTNTQSKTEVKKEASGKDSLIEGLYFNTIRVIMILALFVIMLVFFLKAFPAVDNAVNTVAPTPTKPLKVIKAVKNMKGVKTNG